MNITKSRLAIILSKLSDFIEPNIKLEQYITDSEIASDILWKAFLLGDIEGKKIIDFGSGTGLLTIGCILLGAKESIGYEIDKKAIITAEDNLKKIKEEYEIDNIHFINKDIINDIIEETHCIIQNPPFGTRDAHKDLKFLEKAFNHAQIIYSIHKTSTISYLTKFIEKKGLKVSHKWDYEYPLKATYKQHKRKIQRIKTTCLRIVKKT
jgi:putative methylase